MKLKKSVYNIVTNLMCVLLLAGVAVYLIVNWGAIPDQIPGHYNVEGVIDRWGSKSELLIIWVVGLLLYLGMTAIERFPQIWNTGVQVTRENKEMVYGMLQKMISTLKLIITADFSFLTINSALSRELPLWFLPVFLILTFGTILFFSIKLVRAR